MKARPRILAAIANPEIAKRLGPLLASVDATVLNVARGGAFALASRRRFDLVVAQCPLSGMSAQRILECLRGQPSRNKETPTVLLTREAYLATIERIPAEERTGVTITTSMSDGLAVVARELGLGDRAAVRLLVQVEMSEQSARFQRICQTGDISPSGMLLRTARLLPVGSVLPFSIELPEEAEPIHGRGEVVRHALPEKEHTEGMGVRFLGLDGDGPRRLGGFIQNQRARARIA